MDDKVITELKLLTNYDGNFTFYDVRCIASSGVDVKNQLDYGRAILETQDQLSQYWWSYGPMVKSQWENVFYNFTIESFESDVEIIDYGCGQGLGSLLFLEEFYPDFKKDISKIKLIDPSSLALQRARGILECYSSDIQIVGINKKLDDVTSKELETDRDIYNIHLFSNILDIDDFDQFELFNKIIKNKGNHLFLVVGHDRNFEGGTPRLESIYKALIDPKNDDLKINFSIIKTFKCRNGMSSILFIVDLEVLE